MTVEHFVTDVSELAHCEDEIAFVTDDAIYTCDVMCREPKDLGEDGFPTTLDHIIFVRLKKLEQ